MSQLAGSNINSMSLAAVWFTLSYILFLFIFFSEDLILRVKYILMKWNASCQTVRFITACGHSYVLARVLAAIGALLWVVYSWDCTCASGICSLHTPSQPVLFEFEKEANLKQALNFKQGSMFAGSGAIDVLLTWNLNLFFYFECQEERKRKNTVT